MLRLWIKINDCLIALILAIDVAILLFVPENKALDTVGIYLAILGTFLCVIAILLRTGKRRK